MNTARRIQRYVKELTDHPVAGDPLAAGVLDSLRLEQLVAFVEDTFHVALDDDDFVMENFASVDALASLVDAKRTNGG